MMNLPFLQMLIGFLIVYLCIYALVDRVMLCIEHCATEKRKWYNGMTISLPGIEIMEEEKDEQGIDNE